MHELNPGLRRGDERGDWWGTGGKYLGVLLQHIGLSLGLRGVVGCLEEMLCPDDTGPNVIREGSALA